MMVKHKLAATVPLDIMTNKITFLNFSLGFPTLILIQQLANNFLKM